MSVIRRNSTKFDRLSPVQTLVAQALAGGATDQEAATAAGIHRSTIHEWRKDVRFVAACNLLQAEFHQTLWRRRCKRAIDLVDLAFEVLESTLRDDAAPAAARVRAAALVLEKFMDFHPKATTAPQDPATLNEHWRKTEELSADPFMNRTWHGRFESEAHLSFAAEVADTLETEAADHSGSTGRASQAPAS